MHARLLTSSARVRQGRARLAPAALERIESARAEIAALEALAELAELLDPDAAARWATAGAISERLARFEATAWPRIRVGHRAPRDRLEDLLARLAASALPRTQDNISRLLD